MNLNSIQLTQRLARNLNVPDTFHLPADAALDVLSAMNAGLSAFYRKMPGVYKRTTLSHTIRAPRALTLVFQAQYSRLVADNTFGSRDQGCTVRFGDGSSDNVVTGANSLLDNYLGEVLSVAATLYADAIPVQDVIERVIGNLRLYARAQSQPTYLVRDERLRGGMGRRSEREDLDAPCGVSFGAIGRPQYYFLEPMGVSQSAEPEFILRIAPLPDMDYTIRMEAELSTQRLVFADMTTAREIAVGASYVDDILIPLCEAALVSSAFWRDKDRVAKVTEGEEKAIAKMVGIPSDIAPSSNRVGTPAGF